MSGEGEEADAGVPFDREEEEPPIPLLIRFETGAMARKSGMTKTSMPREDAKSASGRSEVQ